jgi:hypothetical protein
MLTEAQLAERRTNCPIEGCDGTHVPNVPLMRKILDRIREDPNSWHQRDWAIAPGDQGVINVQVYDPETGNVYPTDKTRSLEVRNGVCETAFCIAGHAAMLSEDPLDWDGGLKVYRTSTISGWEVNERAMHELGLTVVEADALFWGGNSWTAVKEFFRQYASIAGDEL